jgi:hypothetical protein
MGLRWHLGEHLKRVDLDWASLEARLGFAVPGDLRGDIPPCSRTSARRSAASPANS